MEYRLLCHDALEESITTGLLYKVAYNSISNVAYSNLTSSAQFDATKSIYDNLDKQYNMLLERVVPTLRMSDNQLEKVEKSKARTDTKNIATLERMAELGSIKGGFGDVISTLDEIMSASSDIINQD